MIDTILGRILCLLVTIWINDSYGNILNNIESSKYDLII
jgi:hypothetical protein